MRRILVTLAAVILAHPFTVGSAESACWTEPKTIYPPERICGDVSKAPSNAYAFSDRP